MSYIYNFDDPPKLSGADSTLLLGGKGRNLSVMRKELGLPVPPGFTITTETGRLCRDEGWPEDLDDELREQMARVEDEVGRRFGGTGEPLLVSVRSGAAVSMPGMMDTILNLGLNEENVVELTKASGDDGFAYDSLRRLDAMYRQIVGVHPVPTDPWEQLREAIEAVFGSWDSHRARSYRQREGIPHDLGTAVTVQAMVFGNLDDNSGTGVMFTRNPATGERKRYGDVLFRSQGEDVVAGTHNTESVEELGQRLPEVADELRRHSETLEHRFRDVCDIEFTIERGKLWLLQVRIGKRSPRAAFKCAVDMAEDDGFPLTKAEAVERVAHHLVDPPVEVTQVGPKREPLASGLPASPGLATGRIATTAETAISMSTTAGDVILVRPETSPNDVHGMAVAKGILTSRGGLASHAAVVAREWGIPAVVGAEAVEVRNGTIVVNGHSLAEGEVITIDGQSGDVYAGTVDTETVVSPEARKLVAWAEELGLELPQRVKSADDDPAIRREHAGRQLSPDTVLRAMHIKGFVTTEALAPVVLSSTEVVQRILEEMEAEGLVKPTGPMFQLTEAGKETAASLIGEDREEWTDERANEALEGFLPLDGLTKEIVTAWQMREVEGEQVLNDHSDKDYDRGVIERLQRLHRDAAAWLAPLTGELERLEMYLQRLDRAATRVSEGDHTYISSPRVDSYHNAWFELHEDLIQLAGRTRQEETEAGRA